MGGFTGLARRRDDDDGIQRVFGCLNEGVALLDAASRSILYANDAMAFLVGYGVSELVALPSFFALAAPAEPAPADRVRSISSLARRFEVSLVHRSGRRVEVEVGISEYGPQRQLAIVRDVTSRKRAEDALLKVSDALEQSLHERSQELRDANAALQQSVRLRDEFLTIASHELRTPLTPLLLKVQMLGRIADLHAGEGPTGRDLGEGLRVVTRHVKRLVELVEQLLDVSRVQAGVAPLDRDTLDLAALVHRVVARVSSSPSSRTSPIAFEHAGAVTGAWDAERLEQAIGNVLSNAIKYGAGKPVHVTLEATASHARLSVQDHGIGIADEDQLRIFDRFERAVPSRNYGGFGVGLWIARSAVEAHGGTISVRSAPGEGATFVLELPRAAP